MRQSLIVLAVAVTALWAAVDARAQTTDIDRAISDNPGLAAIVGADPAREAQIRERLRRANASGPEALEQEALAIGREFAEQMMPQLIGSVPDETVLAFVRVTTTALNEAAAQSGAHCHTFLIGGQGGGEMPALRASTSQKLSDILVDITVTGARGDRQRMLSEAEIGPVLDEVVNRTFEFAGGDTVNFEAVANLPAIRDDRTKSEACQTTIYFYRAILDLPPGDAAALFRTIMAAP